MMASVQLCASLMICDDPVYFRALGYLGDNRVRGSEAQKVSCPWDRDLGIVPSVSWSQGCVTKQSSFKRALLLRTCTSHKCGAVWVAGTAAEQLRAREGVGVGVGGMDPVLIWLKIQYNKEDLESPLEPLVTLIVSLHSQWGDHRGSQESLRHGPCSLLETDDLTDSLALHLCSRSYTSVHLEP